MSTVVASVIGERANLKSICNIAVLAGVMAYAMITLKSYNVSDVIIHQSTESQHKMIEPDAPPLIIETKHAINTSPDTIQVYQVNDANVLHSQSKESAARITTPMKPQRKSMENDTTNAQKSSIETTTTTGQTWIQYTDIKALISPDNTCHDKPEIVGYIHTRADAFPRRNLIRETFGSVRQHDGLRIRLLFVVGTVANSDVQRQIEVDARKHNDVIQLDFVDAYRNLTFKHINGMRWIYDRCPDTKVILKLDDDVFVNVYRLVEFYKSVAKQSGFNDLVYCTTASNEGPIRSRSRYRVTPEDYSSELYPTFCRGCFEIFSRDAVRRIYDVARTTKLFWLDDVFVTGVLRDKANVSATHLYPHYGSQRRILRSHRYGFVRDCLFVAYHDVVLQKLTTLWRELQNLLENDHKIR